jgi:hypothetical protein
MSAMRVAKLGKSKRLIAYTLTLVFNLSVLLPIPAPAISFNSAPARVWGHIYAATEKIERVTAQKKINLNGKLLLIIFQTMQKKPCSTQLTSGQEISRQKSL